MYKTFGVIGDIHTEHLMLERALMFFESKVDVMVSVGDIADGYGEMNACCDLLREYHVQTVRGNHDRWLMQGAMRTLLDASSLDCLRPDNIEWIRSLPPTREYETERGRLLLCHGLGENDMAKVNPDDFGYALESNTPLQDLIHGRYYKLVINGHSHRRMVRTFGGVTIINAGTIKRNHQPCIAKVDISSGAVEYYAFWETGEVKLAETRRFDEQPAAFMN